MGGPARWRGGMRRPAPNAPGAEIRLGIGPRFWDGWASAPCAGPTHMSLWEYKIITSGKGGFATPAMLEKFLNDLGRDEWEIVHYQTLAENSLAFTGLARRSTQRDWTLQDAAAAAAKAEAEKLRAEFEAKFKAASSPAPAAGEERAPSFLEERSSPEDGFRKPVDTSRDDEPEVAEDDKDDWDKLTAAEEEELPTFFEAMKPHMRRNQRGPGMSVGVDYLAKKWDQTEEDIKGALVECGFVMPVDEDSKAEYVEYDGDLYWLNINRRGELWINTKEKPRPVFRSVKAARVEVEAPAPREDRPAATDAKPADGNPDGAAPAEKPEAQEPKPDAPRGAAAPLPEGPALLAKIRPHMRRNRRGPGGSGSASFLSQRLRTNEAELKNAFIALGLVMPAAAADKPQYTVIGEELWWLNLDSRGGLWINGREKGKDETAATAAAADAAAAPAPGPEGAPAAEGTPAPESAPGISAPNPASETAATETAPASEAPAAAAVEPALPPVADVVTAPPFSYTALAPVVVTDSTATPFSPFAAVRPLLKEAKTGGVSAKLEQLAQELAKPVEEVVAQLVGAGLKVPEKPREKPVVVEHAGENLWLSLNAKGDLWLNAKPPGAPDKGEDDGAATGDDKPRRGIRPRGRK